MIDFLLSQAIERGSTLAELKRIKEAHEVGEFDADGIDEVYSYRLWIYYRIGTNYFCCYYGGILQAQDIEEMHKLIDLEQGEEN